MKLLLSAIGLIALAMPPVVSAQWPAYPTPGVPKTADGKPDLAGPAPRTADGHPDLSGLWQNGGGGGGGGQRGQRGAAAGAAPADAPPAGAPPAGAPPAPGGRGQR